MPDKSVDWGSSAVVLWVPDEVQPTAVDFLQNPQGYERDDWRSLHEAVGFVSSKEPHQQPAREGKTPWIRTGQNIFSPDEVAGLVAARVSGHR